MPQKPRKSARPSHHPIRHGPPSRRHKQPGPRPPKTVRAAVPVDHPPGPADVWRWVRLGAMDGFLFMLGSLIASIIQMQTGMQWLFLIGIVIAIALTNLRRLPVRPKAVKSGYFCGMSALFTAGMLAMLFVMPPAAWGGVLAFAAILAVVSVVSLRIGLSAAAPRDEV